tara:strand:- start:888 stop:1475 length:588 start_codon:yes stop_codon:yes gene_type:complete
MFSVKNIFLIIVLVVITSCQSPASFSNLNLNFDHLEKVSLNIKSLEFINNYEPPYKRPYIDHLYDETISEKVERYFQYKINTNKSSKRLRIIIKEASLKKISKKNSDKLSIEKLFSDMSSVVYHAVLKVEVQVVNERGFVDVKIDTDVFIREKNSGNLSINEESTIYFEICESLILLLDKQLDLQMKKYFYEYFM